MTRNRPPALQLTERTNQHNACKWPIADPSLLLAAVATHRAVTFEASDRFGHHGMVGLVVTDLAPTPVASAGVEQGGVGGDEEDGEEEGLTASKPILALHVRCWLLSCRSLHLGIEHMMLRHTARLASDCGASHLAVHWVRAERNEPAAAFLFSLQGVGFQVRVCKV